MKVGRIIIQPAPGEEAKQDKLNEKIEVLIQSIFSNPITFVRAVVPNNLPAIRDALIKLCDQDKCLLVFTTGNLGAFQSDVTPDATRAAVDRELPAFGEIMRYYAFERSKVALLSRATAGIRGKTIIINLPTYPKPIGFCLRLLREGLVDAVEQVSGFRPTLKVPEIVLPLEKYLPFLKYLKPKNPPFMEPPPDPYLF